MKDKITLLPHEVFSNVQKIEDRDQRIGYLKKNAYKQVKTILQLAYNDKVELDFPEGAPPYKENDEVRFPIVSMNRVFKNIGNCTKQAKYSKIRKERWFIGILETLSAEDAKILIAAKDGNLSTFADKKYSKITKSLVEDTFPEIL
jgi:type II restriction/modification system DNA methylase subunit YeeA